MKVSTIPDSLKKNRFYLLFAAGVFVVLALSINFHTDGSSVTPGDYSICRAESSCFAFFYDGDRPNQVFVEERNENAVVPQRNFTLVFLADKKYYIEDDAGNRLTPQSDKVVMTDSSTSDSENQVWQIRRWRNSNYFTITNVESGLSLIAGDVGPVQYGEYIDNNQDYLFRIVPAA